MQTLLFGEKIFYCFGSKCSISTNYDEGGGKEWHKLVLCYNTVLKTLKILFRRKKCSINTNFDEGRGKERNKLVLCYKGFSLCAANSKVRPLRIPEYQISILIQILVKYSWRKQYLINIARGTTDPGYSISNLSYVSQKSNVECCLELSENWIKMKLSCLLSV